MTNDNVRKIIQKILSTSDRFIFEIMKCLLYCFQNPQIQEHLESKKTNY